MADVIPQAPPSIAVPNSPGAAPQQNLPGTSLPVPIGGGVESLITVPAPFRTNAPPWYSPKGTVWSDLGCAVPQVGRYLTTNNGIIYDFVNMAGSSLFEIMWKFDDRKFARYPSKGCLFEIHQMLTLGRDRLAAKTTLPNGTPLVPTRARPSPKMFLVYPVPLYGQLGCTNQYLREVCEMTMLMISEAMQHADNELAYYVTRDFFDVAYGYLQYLLVDMATKFFGEDPVAASAITYRIPDAKFQAYNPADRGTTPESTSTRPPPGYTPTDIDLEPIRAKPYEEVVAFLQPWPDQNYQYSTGGIWGNPSSPAGDVTGIAGAAAGLATTAANLAALAQRPGAP